MSGKPVCDFCDRPDGPFVSGPGCYICRRCTQYAADRFGLAITLPSNKPLTRRQSELYDYLTTFTAEHKYAPSFEQIAARFGYSSLATVHEHLSNLERKGWIKRSYAEKRAITLLVDRKVAA